MRKENFDWVSALRKCLIGNEFMEELRGIVQENVDERNEDFKNEPQRMGRPFLSLVPVGAGNRMFVSSGRRMRQR